MNDNETTGWWQRHWKWAVPVGCTGMIVLLVLAIGGFILMVMSFMKSSDIYEQAMVEARAHPELRRALGEPIEDGRFPMGSVSIEGSSGQADLTIPLSGPNGEAKLYVIAEKRAGQWEMMTLEAELLENNRRVDLLTAGPPN